MSFTSTEKALHRYAVALCRQFDVLCYKMEVAGRRGFPDLMLISPMGRLVFVELKTPKKTGKLSALQKNEHKRLRACGLTVVVADDQDDIKKTIAALITEQ